MRLHTVELAADKRRSTRIKIDLTLFVIRVFPRSSAAESLSVDRRAFSKWPRIFIRSGEFEKVWF